MLWNRNDLLRFRFRLWKSFFSGFGSVFEKVQVTAPIQWRSAAVDVCDQTDSLHCSDLDRFLVNNFCLPESRSLGLTVKFLFVAFLFYLSSFGDPCLHLVKNVFYFLFFISINSTINSFTAAVLLRVVPGLVNATQSQQPQRKQEKKRKVRVQHVPLTLGGLNFVLFWNFEWDSNGECSYWPNIKFWCKMSENVPFFSVFI